MDEAEAATRDAIAALVHRLRSGHGDTDPLGADAFPFAEEFITAMKAAGWRPVLVPSLSADWRRRTEGGGAPDPSGPGGADYLAAKAAITSRVTGPQPALRDDDGRQDQTQTATEGNRQ